MSVVNEKCLVKLIRKAAKETLIWQRTEDVEYITNSHWMVKAKSTSSDVRAELFKVFGREAQPGESFCKRFGNIGDNGPDCSKIHSLEGALTATLTPIIVKGDSKNEDKRIVRVGSELAAISCEYAELTTTTAARAKNATHPIYFGVDGEILILPVRIEGGWVDKIAEHIGKAATA